MFRTITRRIMALLFWLALSSILLVLVFRWLPLPFTGLMIERKIESWIDQQPIDLQHHWLPWQAIASDLKIAVIAAEDQRFAEHWGFDLTAIQSAVAHNRHGGTLRGASTISQQVAKNLFLWSGRNWLRKGLEVWFTGWIELLWPKRRILEVYLNSVEWGNGIFGAEAAARYHFGVAAQDLSLRQSSLLAAVLPNPRYWRAGRPSDYIASRASWIRQQTRQLGGEHYLKGL